MVLSTVTMNGVEEQKLLKPTLTGLIPRKKIPTLLFAIYINYPPYTGIGKISNTELS